MPSCAFIACAGFFGQIEATSEANKPHICSVSHRKHPTFFSYLRGHLRKTVHRKSSLEAVFQRKANKISSTLLCIFGDNCT